jgi:hypothetical protein
VPSNFTVPFKEALASGGADQPARIDRTSANTQTVQIEMNEDLDFISSFLFLFSKMFNELISFAAVNTSATMNRRQPRSLSLSCRSGCQLCPMATQRAEIVHNVPSLIGRHRAGKRWHGRAVQTGDQVAEHIPIRASALEPGPARKVERRNRVAFAIAQADC